MASSVTRLFDRLSSVYDTPAVQAVMYRPAQDEIIGELRRSGSKRIADVGCGTGILASRIASQLNPDHIYGFDLSTGMLSQARARSEQVEWVEAPSESLPLDDGSLDAVVSSHAFHFFEQPRSLGEFHRVLRPGGLLAVVIVNPRTPAGGRLVTMSSGGAGRFPDQRAMSRLFSDAGFASVTQRRVRRGPLSLLSPDLLTVASRP
jgi:ubiquinone/menaquinone biosynthesis C-methylase UbiE